MAKRLIQVCGDPTIDRLSISWDDNTVSGETDVWRRPLFSENGAGPTPHPGGAILLTKLVAALAPTAVVQGLDEADTQRMPTTWSVWRPREDAKPDVVPFRMDGWQEYEPGSFDYSKCRRSGRPDLLVIEDTGLGFRDQPDGWPEALQNPDAYPQQILLRLTRYETGTSRRLLEHLVNTKLAEHTTVVTSVLDLRACAVRVGFSLSWERMFEEVIQAVGNPVCGLADNNGRLIFQRVIVQVGAAGAVVLQPDSDPSKPPVASLIFDRSGQERDFDPQSKGIVPGYALCMAAALAVRWRPNLTPAAWLAAVRYGVALTRVLYLTGYRLEKRKLTFPFNQLAAALSKHGQKGVWAQDPWDLAIFTDSRRAAGTRQWSILEETYGVEKHDAIAREARSVVRVGPKSALSRVPVATVGKWNSADRVEIEGVRSVHNAIRDYLQLKDPETPLCIGVFGPPGAGKSFAVQQVARGLDIGKDAQLTFNLSQFESPEELAGAFHQIRDLHLKGKTPLVFWDEFDTPCAGKNLGWLRYFLAPMQDGEFSEKGRVHPVGGGIYVFAGGTRPTFHDFCQAGPEDAAAKKPDFISRLRAYIDVRGPNPNPNSLEDRLYFIRRAVLLNSYLDKHARQLKDKRGFQVEQGVLDAFLLVSRYKHGARSMENLVKASNLAGRRKFELSALPPDSILEMHVPAPEFADLTRLGYKDSLRIGITGHIGLDPARMAQLLNGIERGAAFIEKAFPNRTLTVFSPMGAGADRLVAREFLKREAARLIAVLPVPREDYAYDFSSTDRHDLNYAGAELRQEFFHWLNLPTTEVIELRPAPTRNDAYARAGKYIADHCDVMVAVWDGEKAQGLGGTGDIVRMAQERPVPCPILHVWAGNHKQDKRKRTDVGDKHGQFRYRNFPGQTPDVWSDEP